MQILITLLILRPTALSLRDTSIYTVSFPFLPSIITGISFPFFGKTSSEIEAKGESPIHHFIQVDCLVKRILLFLSTVMQARRTMIHRKATATATSSLESWKMKRATILRFRLQLSRSCRIIAVLRRHRIVDRVE